ncbi:MAG: helix-turn-helix domain-containing protein [Spirochaetota bacterium]
MKERLSAEDINKLKKIHRKVKTKTESDKIKCVIFWGKGWKWKDIKEVLFISEGTIKAYIDRYKSGGVEELLATNYDSHSYKLTKEQEQEIVEYVIKNNVFNTKQVCNYVKKRFNVEYTEKGMRNALNRLGLYYKKSETVPYKVDSYLQGLHQALSYIKRFSSLNDDEAVYFINVYQYDHNTDIQYGWTSKEKKQIKEQHINKKLILNIAYNLRTDEVITLSKDETDCEDSITQLVKKIVKAKPKKNKIILLLYNVTMEENKNLWKFINNEKKEIELIYIPPYKEELVIAKT